MMAPDYAHWHGMYEVAERFYQELIPQAREMAEHGKQQGNAEGAETVLALIDEILARPEHEWYEKQTKEMKAAGAAAVAAPPETATSETTPPESATPETATADSDSEGDN